MTHIKRDELDQYLRPGRTGSPRWEFPNGHHVSVIPDPRGVLLFEVLTSAPADAATGHIIAGLTTEQVVAKLAEVYALPTPELIVAWVTVNDNGHLIPSEDGRPGSTVTVGDETWSVPNKVEHGGVLWMSRVGYALREFGWRPVSGADHDFSRPGVIGVPVERIETDEGRR